jgi:hypothetical protein
MDFPLKIQNWFPADRAWCYGSDTDLYWAFIAGSSDCIEDLIHSAGLEALRVNPSDAVTFGLDPVHDPHGLLEPRF